MLRNNFNTQLRFVAVKWKVGTCSSRCCRSPTRSVTQVSMRSAFVDMASSNLRARGCGSPLDHQRCAEDYLNTILVREHEGAFEKINAILNWRLTRTSMNARRHTMLLWSRMACARKGSAAGRVMCLLRRKRRDSKARIKSLSLIHI